MQSLFVLALPRTLSTQVYQFARRALSLQQPGWVLDGEILNIDRYAHYHGIRFDESAKFTTPEHDPALVAQLDEFLDQTTVAEGFIYKDVIQPFVMAEWRGLRNFKVLKIERDVSAVAYAMLQHGWFYPQATAFIKPLPTALQYARRITPFKYSDKLHRLFRHQFEDGVVRGLVRAEHILKAIPGAVVSFDELVQDETFLRNALLRLYPNAKLETTSYMDKVFQRNKARQLKRRETDEFRRLCAKVERLRREIL